MKFWYLFFVCLFLSVANLFCSGREFHRFVIVGIRRGSIYNKTVNMEQLTGSFSFSFSSHTPFSASKKKKKLSKLVAPKLS